jgi:O-antigen ligase
VPVVAVFVSLSRSAMFGLGVTFLAGAWFRRPDGSAARQRHARWLTAGVLLAGAAVFFRVDPAAVGERIAAAPVSLAGRLAIWHDTWPVVRDFWLTGTGAGTYETVMLLYQRSMPEVRFNQAHNHYLQLAAEGGLLLAVPLVLALVAFVRDVNERLTTDDSGMYYMRAGAICGLLGVAAQSLFETGLTTPANAFLAAVLAAIVVHVPLRSNRSGEA